MSAPTAEELARADVLQRRVDFLRATHEERVAMLAAGTLPRVPPGACEVRIELQDGVAAQGMWGAYIPAAVELWSVEDGWNAVPFALLPYELQRCFPDDPNVRTRKAVAALTERIEKLATTLVSAAEARREELEGIAQTVAKAAQAFETLLQENERLHIENLALEGELEIRGT